MAIYRLEPGFTEARIRFKRDRNLPSLKVHLRAAISRAKLDRLSSDDPDSSIQNQTQRLLVYVMQMHEAEAAAVENAAATMYTDIAKLVGQTAAGLKWLTDRFCGRYRYFRKHAPVEYLGLKVVEGAISVFPNENGEVVFEHRSEDWGVENPKPEHTGLVFYSSGKVYFAGGRTKMLRLAVVRLSIEDDPQTAIIDGLVLSVRNKSPGVPFAAHAVLIHEDNPELLAFREPPTSPEFANSHRLDEHCDPHAMLYMSL